MIGKLSFLATAFGFLVLGLFCSNVMASDSDLKTEFTINQPVSIPGHVVLPSGTYVIRRLDPVSGVVQILDKDEMKVCTTALTIPDIVMTPPEKPTFTFQEMGEGTPVALKAWYYPGRSTGYEIRELRNRPQITWI